MAGAGAVVGLHYLAPKGMNSKDPAEAQAEALKNTVNFGVSDAIYEMIPINYKTFVKSGPSADLFNDYWFRLPEVQVAIHQSGMSDAEALCSDLLLLQGAMLCPSDVNYFSKGLCGHAQFLEELIDFEAVRRIDPNDIEIEINAFCIEDKKIVDFTNYQRDKNDRPVKTADGKYIRADITADHLRAALAYPFLHAPYKIGAKHYYEGAAIQCLNDYTIDEARDIEWVVVLDPLRASMIGIPNNLWEAFALSIIMPTAGLAELGRRVLQLREKIGGSSPRPGGSGALSSTGPGAAMTGGFAALASSLKTLPGHELLSPLDTMMVVHDPNTPSELYFSEFEIPEDKLSRTWGWSRSSMKDLFKIGEVGGTSIADKMRTNHHL
jgi:hypothetical protein